jgi:hypothetical protein
VRAVFRHPQDPLADLARGHPAGAEARGGRELHPQPRPPATDADPLPERHSLKIQQSPFRRGGTCPRPLDNFSGARNFQYSALS